MSKEKIAAKVEPTVMGTVSILVYEDGNVAVQGPVNNPVVMLNIFGKALTAVANHVARDMVVPSKSDIVPA